MLKTDNNTQGVLFRIRKGADVNRSLKQLKNFSLQARGRPYEPSRGQVGTILGRRNGIPDNQAQDLLILQDKAMNQRTRFPYHSNDLKHILPTVYNGNVNILASSGGAPLAYALNNPTELQQRIFAEGMRASEKNPLSAKFAAIARQRNFNNAVQGPATDIMRRELAGSADDKATTERKISSGHFGLSRSTHLTSDTQVDPEIEAFRNQHRPPTRSDLINFQTRFNAPVQRITGSTVQNVNSINSTLNSMRAPGYHARVPSVTSSVRGVNGSSVAASIRSGRSSRSGRLSLAGAPYQIPTPSAPPAPINVISSVPIRHNASVVSGRSRNSINSLMRQIQGELRLPAAPSARSRASSISSIGNSSVSGSASTGVDTFMRNNGLLSQPASSISGSSRHSMSSRRSGGRTPLRQYQRGYKDPLSGSSQNQIGVPSTVRRNASTQQVGWVPPSIRQNRRSGVSGRNLTMGSRSSRSSGSSSHAWAI